MNHLSQNARALLCAARHGEGGPPLPRERVRGRLLASMSSGAVTSTALAAEAALLQASIPAAGTAWVSVALKAFLLGAALGAAGSMAANALMPRAVETKPLAAPAVTPAPPSALRRREPEQSAAAPTITSPPAVSSESVVTESARASVKASLAGETQLIGKAQVMLRQGHPAQALAVLDQYRVAYPRGAMFEEAAAARVVALCALGRTSEGRRSADEFARFYPRSLLLARVNTACAPGE